MRILIVEDDASVRESLTEALRGEVHTMLDAIDGLDAWQQLHEVPEVSDLILLDLMMPRMNGEEFRARQLRKPRLASIPTIVITAQVVGPELRTELGIIPIFPKFHPLRELLAAIDEVTQPPSTRKH